VFEITESATGKAIPCAEKDITRMRPPKSADFIEVSPHVAMTREISIIGDIDGSGALLEPGKVYDFRVKARYKAIWKADVQKVDRMYLGKTGGGSGMVDWEYETNTIAIKAP